MFLSPQQEVAWCQEHKATLAAWAEQYTLIILPSFLSLHILMHIFADTAVQLGAQDCSAHTYGPHTGQISAQAVAELGCSHVLLGHAERRALGETDELIAQKLERARQAQLTPILCVDGATSLTEFAPLYTRTFDSSVSCGSDSYSTRHRPLGWPPCVEPHKDPEPNDTVHPSGVNSGSTAPILAYEPAGAIGTGVTPAVEEIAATIERLPATKRIYGGSVSSKNAASLATIPGLDGFLVGRASLDIQELRKIVESFPN
jgi:triosephosphate isomerase